MSTINLGNDGLAAAKALRGNEHWERILRAIGEAADRAVDHSIGSDPARRIEDTAYARGLRDTWIAMEAATRDTNQRVVQKRSTTGAASRKPVDTLSELTDV